MDKYKANLIEKKNKLEASIQIKEELARRTDSFEKSTDISALVKSRVQQKLKRVKEAKECLEIEGVLAFARLGYWDSSELNRQFVSKLPRESEKQLKDLNFPFNTVKLDDSREEYLLICAYSGKSVVEEVFCFMIKYLLNRIETEIVSAPLPKQDKVSLLFKFVKQTIAKLTEYTEKLELDTDIGLFSTIFLEKVVNPSLITVIQDSLTFEEFSQISDSCSDFNKTVPKTGLSLRKRLFSVRNINEIGEIEQNFLSDCLTKWCQNLKGEVNELKLEEILPKLVLILREGYKFDKYYTDSSCLDSLFSILNRSFNQCFNNEIHIITQRKAKISNLSYLLALVNNSVKFAKPGNDIFSLKEDIEALLTTRIEEELQGSTKMEIRSKMISILKEFPSKSQEILESLKNTVKLENKLFQRTIHSVIDKEISSK